ncbi:MAG: O-acetyl-ADP-ribose deacetylase [Planctomycetota bacterium]|nr:O-acetyl-ADP-ribose deacetylase [Planctomycetota bacterium]
MNEPEVIVGDITRLEVDAIVNAANAQLAPGGGVCGAIHRAAGPRLTEECARVGPCPTGEARITGGYELPADRVIHTVGPVYHGGCSGEPEQLVSCYRGSLELAEAEGLRSIAFPCISTGVFGYPIEDATRIALDTIRLWLGEEHRLDRVICCCFTESDARVYRELLAAAGG